MFFGLGILLFVLSMICNAVDLMVAFLAGLYGLIWLFVVLGLALLVGEVVLIGNALKQKTDLKIISQKVETGSKYEVVVVGAKATLFSNPANIKYKLSEVDVIDSRD